MSQYGAYGFSKHGADYRQILAHYYRDTAIGRRDGGTMRVLLEPNQSAIMFRTGRQRGREAARPEQALHGEAQWLHCGSPNRERSRREARRRHHHDLGRAARDADREGRERSSERGLPRQHRDPHRDGARAELDQCARSGELRPRRRAEREPLVLAGRRARGAGGRRPYLRDHEQRRRPRVQPVRRHPQPGVSRLPERDAVHWSRDHGHTWRSGDLWREGRHDVLLLDLGWLHGGQRERLHGRRRAALATRRRGPLRRLFALPPVGPVLIFDQGLRRQARQLGAGALQEPRRAPAGSLTAGGARGGARICRQHGRHRTAATRPAGTARHLVLRAPRVEHDQQRPARPHEQRQHAGGRDPRIRELDWSALRDASAPGRRQVGEGRGRAAEGQAVRDSRRPGGVYRVLAGWAPGPTLRVSP